MRLARFPRTRLLAAAGLVAAGGLVAPAQASTTPAPTPKADCGPGSLPETGVQGRIPASDYTSGRTKLGYRCNVEQVGHEGGSGGFRVHRYVDAAGRDCAYYDTSLLVGTSLLLSHDAGVAVLDMADPAHPVRTDTLRTPAMLSPHESLNLNQKRGLLAAIMGSPATAPGVVDIYDVSADCRHPVLKSSSPIGIAGHEATFSPDGNTFYTAATASPYVSAIDVTNPALPTVAWNSTSYTFHGMNVSDDGTRLYAADILRGGLTVLDVSQVQQRKASPAVREISHLTWATGSIAQTAIPVRIGGQPYLVEIDEYAGSASSDPAAPVGAGRIIDIADEAHPAVVSDLRLEVNQPDQRAGDQQNDPGASNPAQGYAGHYCAVPQRNEPGIVACSFILSGLRVFDIRDPRHPKETAYFNPPTKTFSDTASLAAAAPNLFSCRIAVTAAHPSTAASSGGSGSGYSPWSGSTIAYWAMSAPTFVPERNEVWYSDGMYGFYSLKLTNGAWPR